MKVAPWPSPSLDAATVPPCSSTRCLHDGQPQAQAAVLARGAAVRLAEALEDVRQELRRRCPARCPRTRDLHRRVAPLDAVTCTRPPLGVNFTALVSRFQTTCCSRSGSPHHARRSASSAGCSRMPLASAAGRTVSSAASTTAARSTGSTVEPQLAGHDAADVQQILDELGLGARVALDGLERALAPSPAAGAPRAQHLHPAQDGRERRAQLVADAWRGTRPSGGWSRSRLRARRLLAREQPRALGLGPLLLGDVAADGGEPADAAGGAILQGEDVAVRGDGLAGAEVAEADLSLPAAVAQERGRRVPSTKGWSSGRK